MSESIQPSGTDGVRSGSLPGVGVGVADAEEGGSQVNSASYTLSFSSVSGIKSVGSITSFKVFLPGCSLTRSDSSPQSAALNSWLAPTPSICHLPATRPFTDTSTKKDRSMLLRLSLRTAQLIYVAPSTERLSAL